MIIFSYFLTDFHFFSVEIFLSESILFFAIYSFFLSVSPAFGYFNFNKNFSNISLLIIFLSYLIVATDSVISVKVFGNSFIHDNLAFYLKIVILLFAFFCFSSISDFLFYAKINRFEYFLLILSVILSLLLLVSSYDLISIFLALEMQSLCFYVLASFKKENSLCLEAGLKYFVFGAFSSAVLLFGIFLVFYFTGTTNFDKIYLILSTINFNSIFFFSKFFFLLLNSFFFIFLSLLFKLGSFPFYFWLPDIYEGSPTFSVLIFALLPKIVVFTIFLRILKIVCELQFFFKYIFLFCAFFSIFIGIFLTFQQKNIKRFLAYSSISHVGFMLLPLLTPSLEAIESLFFYIFPYMITTFILWNTFFFINNKSLFGKSKVLSNFIFLGKDNIYLGLILLFTFFSLAGIPPLLGFLAKLNIFFVAVNMHIYLPTLIILLLTILSGFYYLKIIKLVFFENLKKIVLFRSLNRLICLLLTFLSFLLFYFFINPNILFLVSQIMSFTLIY
jgi:proton-translocating NADH-quinone oxidoreductase chain N